MQFTFDAKERLLLTLLFDERSLGVIHWLEDASVAPNSFASSSANGIRTIVSLA